MKQVPEKKHLKITLPDDSVIEIVYDARGDAGREVEWGILSGGIRQIEREGGITSIPSSLKPEDLEAIVNSLGG